MADKAKLKIHSDTDALMVRMREKGSRAGSGIGLVEHLPKPVSLIIEGRPSARVSKLRQYFLKYTDRWSRPSDEDLYQELSQINHYLQQHVLYNNKMKTFSEDPAIMYLYHAEVPQILLEMLHQAVFNPDFFQGGPKNHCLPYLIIEILTCFMHPCSATFMLFPDKLFDDSKSKIDTISEILRGQLNWFDRFSAIHFFGIASCTPAGMYWLFTHLDTYQEICSSMHASPTFIETQIRRGKVDARDEEIASQLKMFRNDSDLVKTARILGHFITGQSIFVFLTVLEHSRTHYSRYIGVSEAIRAAGVLTNFHCVIKQVMTWPDQTHFLIPFLNGIASSLNIKNALEDLLLNDISDCLKHKIPVGIESLKYWKSASHKFSSRLGWLLVHAFCLDDKYGSGWCMHIICFVLQNGPDKAAAAVIESCGAELMDLAHFLSTDYPMPHMNVQSIILEALLRYAGITHLEWGTKSFEGTMKEPSDLQDFCLEAAIFCKKAHCEEKMDLITKQKRVAEADILKDEGNKHFKAGRFKEAIMRYTDAIAVCPLSARTKQSVYYSNRAESYLRSHEALRAIHDCNRSLCLDKSTKVKVQWRRSRAYQTLDLDYPAWLDMKCLKNVWTLSKADSGIDFDQVLESLGEKVGVIKDTIQSDFKKQDWVTWLLREEELVYKS